MHAKQRKELKSHVARILAFFAPIVLVTAAGVAWYVPHPAFYRTTDLPYSIDPMKKVMPKTADVGFTDVSQEAGISYFVNDPELMTAAKCGATCMAMTMAGGGAAADYDGDGKVDLLVTRMNASPILYRNRGDGTFEDRTVAAGLDKMKNANGAGWADIDNDGDHDLYLTAIDDVRYYLYVNDGRGRFKEEARQRGADVFGIEHHQGYSVALGDYDRDGWVDIVTSQWGFDLRESHMRVLHNLGAARPGHFEDVTEKAGFAVKNEHTWVSYGSPEGALAATRVAKLVQEGKMTPAQAAHATYYDGNHPLFDPNNQTTFSGQFSFSPAFVDLDGDGWQDLTVAADFGTSRIFWNDHDGTFTDGTAAARTSEEEHGMGSTFGDFDGDGRLDWFVTSIGLAEKVCAKAEALVDCLMNSGNKLYHNNGDRSFTDVTAKMGVRQGYWGWGTDFFDYDNDGDLDLVMTNGMNSRARFKDDPLRFWENLGPDTPMLERAEEVGLEDRGAGKGLLTFDYDDDGDLDLFVVNDNAPPRLMRNDGGNGNDWLKVRVHGTSSNRDAMGATVELRKEAGGPVQVREIGAGSHFLGQSDLTAHFGLGKGEGSVAEIMVRWPATGRTATYKDVPRNTTLEAVEPDH